MHSGLYPVFGCTALCDRFDLLYGIDKWDSTRKFPDKIRSFGVSSYLIAGNVFMLLKELLLHILIKQNANRVLADILYDFKLLCAPVAYIILTRWRTIQKINCDSAKWQITIKLTMDIIHLERD